MVLVDRSLSRQTALAISPMLPLAWPSAKSAQKCSVSNSGANVNTNTETRMRIMPAAIHHQPFQSGGEIGSNCADTTT
jgi:hypothetical protein